MNYLQFTEFRNHSKEYFDQVEHGNSYIIIRKGKPIAKIIPFLEKKPGWKRTLNKITLKKKIDSLDYLKQERSENEVIF